jgi:hypothetical protein
MVNKKQAAKAGWKAMKVRERYHRRKHELFGGIAVAFSMLFLFWGWGDGTIPQNTALFNISLIALAMYFPIREHDLLGGHWSTLYGSFLLIGAIISWFVTYPEVNPAVVNIVFGGWVIYWYGYYGRRVTLPAELFAVFMLLGGLFSGIYLAAPHMPPGRAQNAAMGVRSVMDATVVPVVTAVGNVIWDCTINEDTYQYWEPLIEEIPGFSASPGDPSLCRQRIAELATNIKNFLLSFPGGQYIWEAGVYVTDRAFQYAGGMACIGGQGGLSGIAYQNPAAQYDPENPNAPGGEQEPPYGDIQSCFQTDGEAPDAGADGDESGITLETLAVEQRPGSAGATITFSGEYATASASDFSASGPDGSLAVTSAFKQGAGTVVVTMDNGGISPGDSITVSWNGVGSCSDTYAQGGSTSCSGGIP